MLTRKASGRRIQNRIRQHNCRHNCPPVLPMNLGNIWLLYDAHTPSFHPRGSAHWNDPPWSSGVHPLPRDAVFDTHKYQHKGKLYPLYTRGWLAGGLWRMETYLPYCCTTLEVGARHECHCQMRHWAMVCKDVTERSRLWNITYTDNNINICSQHYPRSQHPQWVTIGTQQHAVYDWSLTPWNPSQRHHGVSI